ncbi:DEAD/DEAH box helicase [Bacillus toyonensis]|uniref:DEAD/DEAH box helicase n=1 Tax=Bacillus toyonensis TaxID=155322 RepID=UPI000BF1FACB|nr:DEAD/DEAH box helicase [Bacillus toyonensis]MBF7149451.1 DEAD/DEAH box helicase [Bacillus toyonensis]MEC2348054.1 DEAD/DEAH box helicase [Bacillus toyonensis]MED3188466.1 DEAD/DEAH box helicase [Bacillus toyonensis]PEL37158.1 hypothetical protein CN623_04840 [Bacillus toyonensis]PFY12822.1 hypothetical protein COL47_26545 [Bacillus toyonensis]
MRPKKKAIKHLSITRSKAKMYEYNIPEDDHVVIDINLLDLLDLTISIIGDLTNNERIEDESKKDFLFSAKYFDALINIANITNQDSNYTYLKLLGAVAYYLADYPGSAMVLIKELDDIDLDVSNLDYIILSILKKNIIKEDRVEESKYNNSLKQYIKAFNAYLIEGISGDLLGQGAYLLKLEAYKQGSDRELLLCDIIHSLTERYIKNSAWNTIPLYTKIQKDDWKEYLIRDSAIKELWPSQILLGERKVLQGRSAIVQMPTSAGKTKSCELIVRSAFLGRRTNLAVIVAPFRALCNEIYNDFYHQFLEDKDIFVSLISDVMQMDENLEFNDKVFSVLILTPEKLEYILRHQPELANHIGLIIYDEGHLFDDDSRGIKYELLLASLKRNLSESCQKILISAVIPNAREIGDWLMGNNYEPIEAKNLNPTQRDIAFVNWKYKKAQLQFVDSLRIDQEEFFVPKVMESYPLTLKGRERKERNYPNKGQASEIAMALGCTLVSSGTVAVFVARKDSAMKCAKDIVDAFDRKTPLVDPSELTEVNMLQRFIKYLNRTLGEDSSISKVCKFGIMMHHGSLPEGVRLSVEYAIQKQHTKFVICTSTLSQGVNLPIRYLIVTTTRQGKDEIKTRDFHNLIGRAGRAGKYTEGTIIFSDNQIYDKKERDDWYWNKTRRLLDPSMSERCFSKILDIFLPVSNYENNEEWEWSQNKVKESINQYLLNALENIVDPEEAVVFAEELAQNTLAYKQAFDYQKLELISHFQKIAKRVIEIEPSVSKRKIFSKTILPLEGSLLLFETLSNSIDSLNSVKNFGDLFEFFWPIIYKFTPKLPRYVPEDKLKYILERWIKGDTYSQIFSDPEIQGIRLKKNRNLLVEHVVDLCDGIYGYESSLIIGACIEILGVIDKWDKRLEDGLKLFQKAVKYGLLDHLSLTVYELGFVDRSLAHSIASIIRKDIQGVSKQSVKNALKDKRDSIDMLICEEYPSYYEEVFQRYI